MVNTYIYTGKQNNNTPKPTIATDKDFIIDEATFLINTVRPLKLKKTKGPVCLYKHANLNLINYQIQAIKNICKNPTIIYLVGLGAEKVIKNSNRSEFSVIENKIYEITNSGEDFRLGINATTTNKIVYLHGNLIPTEKSYKLLYRNGKQSSSLYYTNNNNDIGFLFNRYQIVSEWVYGSINKSVGMFYFNEKDTNHLKNIAANNIRKNQFDYELMKKCKIIGVNYQDSVLIHGGE